MYLSTILRDESINLPVPQGTFSAFGIYLVGAVCDREQYFSLSQTAPTDARPKNCIEACSFMSSKH